MIGIIIYTYISIIYIHIHSNQVIIAIIVCNTFWDLLEASVNLYSPVKWWLIAQVHSLSTVNIYHNMIKTDLIIPWIKTKKIKCYNKHLERS